jgi:bacterioferritin-associated ferredoxin
MIVCLCRAVCEQQLRAVVGRGARSLEEVERACGAGGDCGSCQPEIAALLQRQGPRPAAAAATTARCVPAASGPGGTAGRWG